MERRVGNYQQPSELDMMHDIGKAAGFKYVTLDFYGYRTGAMDEVLDS